MFAYELSLWQKDRSPLLPREVNEIREEEKRDKDRGNVHEFFANHDIRVFIDPYLYSTGKSLTAAIGTNFFK